MASFRFLSWCLFGSLGVYAVAWADGGGRLMTPYFDLDRREPVPLARVTCEMLTTEVSRDIENYDLKWPKPFFGGALYAGLAFLDFERAANKHNASYRVEVSHSFTGRASDGKTTTVSFARLEGLDVLGKRGDQMRVRLSLFPTTDIESVAQNKLTYSALRKDVASVVLDVPTRNDKGEELALVSVLGWFDHDCARESSNPYVAAMRSVAVHAAKGSQGLAIEEFARFADLSQGRYAVGFGSEIWWAVPSVISDPAYPHRRKTKK